MCRNHDKAAAKVHRVLMWAPPRSLSTCVERAFIEHKEIHVQHEPFGTPFYWSEDAQSGREAAGGLRKPTYATVADNVLLSRPPPGKAYIFSKNLSYYVAPHCIEQLADWEAQAVAAGDTVVHCFMMRHPAKAISSLYYKSVIDNEGTGYTHFDPVEAGFEQMYDLLRYVDGTGAPSAIIDADDLLENPAGVMEAFSKAVGLPFSLEMLSWPAGPVKELESPFTGWTDDVQKSTGIKRRAKRSPAPSVLTLPDEVQECISRAMAVYKKMAPRRLRAGGVIGDLEGEERDTFVANSIKESDQNTVSVLGMVLAMAAVVLWVGNAEMLQRAYTPGWDKPYCQGLLLKGSWSLMLVFWLVASRWQKTFEDEITFRKPLKFSGPTIALSLVIMLFVQAASVTWIASLPRTPVSANTAIYQVNPLLVYAFSIPLLHEKVSYYKLAAVVLAVAGVWLVALGQPEKVGLKSVEQDSWGYVLVSISTLIFSLKEVLFKRFFPSISLSPTPLTDAMLCVGIIGLGSVVSLPPTLWLLDVSGIETFVWPSTEVMQSYALVALTMALYQTCILASIALTSPTFVATASVLAIPGAMAWDFLALGHVESFVSMEGIAVITLAFVLLVFFSHGGEGFLKDSFDQTRRHLVAFKSRCKEFVMKPLSCPPPCFAGCLAALAGKSSKTSEMV